MNQLHIHGLYKVLLKTQINFMWSLFKMSEILCVHTFDIIYLKFFDIKCVHYTMEIPHSLPSNVDRSL